MVLEILFERMLVVVAGVKVVDKQKWRGVKKREESEIDPACLGKIVFPAPETDGVIGGTWVKFLFLIRSSLLL